MKRVLVLAAVQVAVILGWAGHHEWVQATAPTFRIPLQPIDPYDVLRGRYFILNPVDARVKTGRPEARLPEARIAAVRSAARTWSGPAEVGFCRDGEVHRVCDLRRVGEARTSSAEYWSRARVQIFHEDRAWRQGREWPEAGWVVEIDLGLSKFFIPNRATLPAREREPGWSLEVSHRRGRSPLPRRLWFQDRPLSVGPR